MGRPEEREQMVKKEEKDIVLEGWVRPERKGQPREKGGTVGDKEEK